MKKLNTLLVSVLLLVFFMGNKDSAAQNTFYKVYDGGGNDVGAYVSVTPDGGFIITGKTTSFGGGDFDVWLIRTDAEGNALWKKSYGGIADDEGNCVQPTSDGGFIVAANSVNPGHYNQGWVFKTDAEGSIVWEYKFGGNAAGDEAAFVLPVEDGYLVSGTNDMRSLIIKFDNSGNVVWSQQYFPNNGNTATGICPLGDQGYAVSGTFEFPVGSGDWFPDLFYIKNDGEIITQLTWTNYPGGIVNFVSPRNDGGVIMGGFWNGAPSLINMLGSGNYGWEYGFPLSGSTGSIVGTVQFNDDNFIAAGDWFSAAMVGLNDSGEQQWAKYGRLDGDNIYFAGIQKVDENSVILTGYRNEGNVDHDVILVKSTKEGSLESVDNKQEVKKGTLMQNAPNPFTGSTSFNFVLRDKSFTELMITDISGRHVKTIVSGYLLKGEYSFTWDGKNSAGELCASGTYFATLKLNSGFMQTVKIVKR